MISLRILMTLTENDRKDDRFAGPYRKIITPSISP